MSEPFNLLFHLGMLASLANALEVRLNLAFKLQSIAARASREGILDHIAA
jgi:hypothetical protein